MFTNLYSANLGFQDYSSTSHQINVADVIEDLLLVVQKIINGIAFISSRFLSDKYIEFKIQCSTNHPTVILHYKLPVIELKPKNDLILGKDYSKQNRIDKNSSNTKDDIKVEKSISSIPKQYKSCVISSTKNVKIKNLECSVKSPCRNIKASPYLKLKPKDLRELPVRNICTKAPEKNSNKNYGGICVRKEIPELLPDLYCTITKNKELQERKFSSVKISRNQKSIVSDGKIIDTNSSRDNSIRDVSPTKKFHELAVLDNDESLMHDDNNSKSIAKNKNVSGIPVKLGNMIKKINGKNDLKSLDSVKKGNIFLQGDELQRSSNFGNGLTGERNKNSETVTPDFEYYKSSDLGCCYCKKTFASVDLKLQHEDAHANGKLYSCSYCEASFTRNSSRKRHEMLHTGERPYTCIFCNKGFVELSSKKIHERTHTGEKLYSCSFCDKSFVHLNSKKGHEKMHFRKHLMIL